LEKNKLKDTTTITATASAYKSIDSQVKERTINLAVWGDSLALGVKDMAVTQWIDRYRRSSRSS
jgi:hypothetical protein